MSRYKTTDWHGHPNYECALCKFSTLDQGLMILHVRDAHLSAATADSGAEIQFASDSAEEEAAQLGLQPEHFRRYTPTGKNGYVLGDVRRIAASLTSRED